VIQFSAYLKTCPAYVQLQLKAVFLRKEGLVTGGRRFHLTCEESIFVIMLLNLTEKSLV